MPPRRPPAPGLSLRRTRRGWRLSQHGTVLSEILTHPGPTHSVFDVLAAACLRPEPVRDIALLGFGGGSVVAALRALGCIARLHVVDLDPTGWRLLRSEHADWLNPLEWHHADAVKWLRRTGSFDVIIDDLSIASDGDITKPAATWETLPQLIHQHLRPRGRALFNLLRPPGLGWHQGLAQVAAPFSSGLVLHLRDFENRIFVGERSEFPPVAAPLRPRPWGRQLRRHLGSLASRQAARIRVHSAP